MLMAASAGETAQNTMELIRRQLNEAYHDSITTTLQALPRLVSGIVLVALALVVCYIVRFILRSVLRRVGVDSLPERLGFATTLERMGIKKPLSVLLPRVAFWLLLLLFVRVLADSLGLGALEEAIGSFLAYVPNMLAAAVVLLVGSLLAQFSGRAIEQAAEASGLEFGTALGRAVSALVFFLSAIMAIGQLRIETEIVRIFAGGILGGLALAFGLSFGLGTRDIVRNILSGFYARRVLAPGTEIIIDGRRGTVQAVTPTLTVIEFDQDRMAISNSRVLDENLRLGATTPT